MDKEDFLKKILNDKTSGSTQLLLNLNRIIKNNINDASELNSIIKESKKYFITFSAIQKYISQVEKIKHDSKKLKYFVSSFTNNEYSLFDAVYKNARSYIKYLRTILTLSNSKTLLEIFTLWKKDNPKIKIIIAESRPSFEGRIMAKELLRREINVEIIPDASVPNSIQNADAAIIGADKILQNGNVINKIGSLTAALSCKYFNKPFYVMASKEKYSNDKELIQQKQNPEEIWKHKSPLLNITNFYFEEIDKKLITKIITN